MPIKRFETGTRLSMGVAHGNTVYLAGVVPDDYSLDAKGQIVPVLGDLHQVLGELRMIAEDAHEVGVGAQALGDAGSEPVGLNQHRDQLFEIVHPGTLGQVPQSFHAAFAGLQLQIHKPEFFADFRMGVLQFFGNL